MHYEYSDGTNRCGHNHRTQAAAACCPLHLQLIRQWWRDGEDCKTDEAFREYRARAIADAEVVKIA